MPRMQSLAGTTLTLTEMHMIVPCGGNFTLNSIDTRHEGKIVKYAFDPPYRMRDGEDYAFYQLDDGTIELWQVECIQRGTWRWVQEAKRAKAKTPLNLVSVNGCASHSSYER